MSIKADNQRLCLKVIDRIKDDIQNGVFCENERLPSEFELSKMLGVSRTALREALRILEEENVIIRRHGVGHFVNARPLFLSGIEAEQRHKNDRAGKHDAGNHFYVLTGYRSH